MKGSRLPVTYLLAATCFMFGSAIVARKLELIDAEEHCAFFNPPGKTN
jgi:hypothetical protein